MTAQPAPRRFYLCGAAADPPERVKSPYFPLCTQVAQVHAESRKTAIRPPRAATAATDPPAKAAAHHRQRITGSGPAADLPPAAIQPGSPAADPPAADPRQTAAPDPPKTAPATWTGTGSTGSGRRHLGPWSRSPAAWQAGSGSPAGIPRPTAGRPGGARRGPEGADSRKKPASPSPRGNRNSTFFIYARTQAGGHQGKFFIYTPVAQADPPADFLIYVRIYLRIRAHPAEMFFIFVYTFIWHFLIVVITDSACYYNHTRPAETYSQFPQRYTHHRKSVSMTCRKFLTRQQAGINSGTSLILTRQQHTAPVTALSRTSASLPASSPTASLRAPFSARRDAAPPFQPQRRPVISADFRATPPGHFVWKFPQRRRIIFNVTTTPRNHFVSQSPKGAKSF